MTPTTHGDPFEPPVEQVARTLLEFARQEPSLVGRSHALARGVPAKAPAFDLAAFGSFTQIDVAQQVEHLTAIAIAASQQAEDAFQQARETVRVARRNGMMFGLLGALGVLTGVAAIADIHLFAPGVPAPIVSTPTVQTTVAQADPAPAVGPASSDEAPPQPATYVPPLPVPPAPTPAQPEHFTPPAYHPPPTFVAPWPSESVAVRREPVAVRRQPVVPQFVVALQRGINSLLAVPRNF